MIKDAEGIIIWLVIVMGSSIGWVSNIIKILALDSFSGELVVRSIGVFVPPLGAILGYF